MLNFLIFSKVTARGDFAKMMEIAKKEDTEENYKKLEKNPNRRSCLKMGNIGEKCKNVGVATWGSLILKLRTLDVRLFFFREYEIWPAD